MLLLVDTEFWSPVCPSVAEDPSGIGCKAFSYCYLDGQTRAAWLKLIVSSMMPLYRFLISLKAGGTGLNLTGADMVVHFDPAESRCRSSGYSTCSPYRSGTYSDQLKLIASNTIEACLASTKEKAELLDTLFEESGQNNAQVGFDLQGCLEKVL